MYRYFSFRIVKAFGLECIVSGLIDFEFIGIIPSLTIFICNIKGTDDGIDAYHDLTVSLSFLSIAFQATIKKAQNLTRND